LVRSWQRSLIAGLWFLLGGAVATIAHAAHAPGLVQGAIALLGVIGLAIGGSVIAQAVRDRMIATQLFGLDVGEVVDALRGSNALARSRQTLRISLDTVESEVKATATHTFDMLGSSRYGRMPFSLYTDAVPWGSGGGGFYSIREPTGNVLEGTELEACVENLDGKKQFTKTYQFRDGAPSTFSIDTFGHFRSSDRLIWTVEHISTDFEVHICDRRSERGPLSIKVNHHRRSEIIANKQQYNSPEGPVTVFTFLGEVLPYQGFELQWDDTAANEPTEEGHEELSLTT